MKKRYVQEEPEHYSWDLGTPDNATKTEVIVDPYSSNSDYVYEDDWKQDYPEDVRRLKPERDNEVAKKYYGTGIDPYKNSFTIQVDDREAIVPTIDHTGKELTEDEAINRYLESGINIGERKVTSDMAKAMYVYKLRQMMERNQP